MRPKWALSGKWNSYMISERAMSLVIAALTQVTEERDTSWTRYQLGLDKRASLIQAP